MDAQSTFPPRRNNSSNGVSKPTLDDHCLQAEAIMAGMFGFIAALSFLLNSLFCSIMMRKPAMLKRPHNILLFSLAITDLLTGLQFYDSEFNSWSTPSLNILLINTNKFQLSVEKYINKTPKWSNLLKLAFFCTSLLLFHLIRLYNFKRNRHSISLALYGQDKPVTLTSTAFINI